MGAIFELSSNRRTRYYKDIRSKTKLLDFSLRLKDNDRYILR